MSFLITVLIFNLSELDYERLKMFHESIDDGTIRDVLYLFYGRQLPKIDVLNHSDRYLNDPRQRKPIHVRDRRSSLRTQVLRNYSHSHYMFIKTKHNLEIQLVYNLLCFL